MNASNRDLLRAVLLPDEKGLAAFQQWRQSADLDSLPTEQYPLLPLLHCRLAAWQATDTWTERIKGIYRRTWYANQLALNTLAEGLTAISAAGIRAVVGGGAALALTCYPESAARAINQPEVFVSGAHLRRAQTCLGALKTTSPRSGSSNLLLCLPPSHTGRFFWEDTRPLMINHTSAQMPAPETSLLLACRGLYRSALLARVDAALIAQNSQIEWGDFTGNTLKCQLTLPVLEVLQTLQDILAIAVPAECLLELRTQQPKLTARLQHHLGLIPPEQRSLPARLILKAFRWCS